MYVVLSIKHREKRMSERWHEKEFTANWDKQVADSHPSRAMQVRLLTSLVKHLYQPGKWIVDLGFGSGRVEEQIFRQRSDARVIGIDSSAAMIDLARRRLEPWSGQYEAIQHDLAEIESVQLQSRVCQIAISVQVLHHLKQDEQRNLHRWTYKTLEQDGWYLIIDKRAMEGEDLDAYGAAWNALEQDPQWRTGHTFAEHLQGEREKGHAPATLTQALEWLKDAGFHATCMQAHLDRLLIVAKKP